VWGTGAGRDGSGGRGSCGVLGTYLFLSLSVWNFGAWAVGMTPDVGSGVVGVVGWWSRGVVDTSSITTWTFTTVDRLNCRSVLKAWQGLIGFS
jgi:hypothetical protein